MHTTTPYAELIERAATELNDAADAALEALPDVASAGPEDVDPAVTAMHERLGIDPQAVFKAASDAGVTALGCFSPQEFLRDPVGAFATMWQSGFLVGARTQQLHDADGEA